MVDEVLQNVFHWVMAVMLGCCKIVHLKFDSGFITLAGFNFSFIEISRQILIWDIVNLPDINSVTRVPVVLLA